ncbi:MAG: TonB family protein [Pseudomonadota bacterium]
MSATVASLSLDAPAAPSDRLSLTLFLAAAFHGIIILGVGFQAVEFSPNAPASLDVILVQNHSPDTPEEADYLAQVSQDGGGSSDERTRPTTPFSTPEKLTSDGIAPIPLVATSPQLQEQAHERFLTQIESERRIQQSQQAKQTNTPKQQISDRVIQQNLEIARLSAEISEQLEQYAKRPKKKFITARTKEALAAAYMHAWVRKVERVGNLNYPDNARRRKLSGSLVLAVGINKNGTINELILRSSSGHQLLDDAAKRIVQLAAPFEPITGKLAEQADVLYITRTWEFSSQENLTTR